MTLFLCEYQVKSAVEHANKSYRNFIYWTSFASAHTHTQTQRVSHSQSPKFHTNSARLFVYRSVSTQPIKWKVVRHA